MRKVLKTILLLMVLSFSYTLIACEKPGPTEQAGKKIDGAFEAIKKKAKKLTE